jgi:hypothetical protein
VGRGTSTAPISNPKVPGWCCHRIVDGALDVCVLLFYKILLCHVHWVDHFLSYEFLYPLRGNIVPIFSPNPQQITLLPLYCLVCIVGPITQEFLHLSLRGDIVPIFSPNPQQITTLPLYLLVCIVS